MAVTEGNPDENLVSQSHVPPDHRCPHEQYFYFIGWEAPEGEREVAQDGCKR